MNARRNVTHRAVLHRIGLVVLVMSVTPLTNTASATQPLTREDLFSGGCRICAVQQIELAPDRMVMHDALAFRVPDEKSAQLLSRVTLLEDYLLKPETLLRVRFMPAAGEGEAVDASSEALTAVNRCVLERTRPKGCSGNEAIELPVTAGGFFVFEKEHRYLGTLSGGYRSYYFRDPNNQPNGSSDPASNESPMRVTVTITLSADMKVRWDGAKPDRVDGRTYSWTFPREGVDWFAVSNAPSWKAVGNAYAAVEAQRLAEPAPRVDAIAAELQLETSEFDITAKIERIRGWMNQHVRFRAYRETPADAKTLITPEAIARRGDGDCRELVLLMRALLLRAGIESRTAFSKVKGTPIVLSESVPVQSASDHVIVYLPALDRYIDATVNFGTIDDIAPETGKQALPYAIRTDTGEVHFFKQ